MQRVDLKIGFNCNNHCTFCVQGDKRSRFSPKPMNELEAKLKEGRSKGAEQVVFTGGEPSVHKSFLPAIRLARNMGYESIQIQTNGRMFCYPDFCEKTVEAGATEFSPSLHGSTAKLHEFLTGAEGSYLQTVTAIRNLKKLGVMVLTNTVITRANYRDLPVLARLFVRLGVDQFQFAFVHIAGTALKNQEWLVPRKSLAEPWIKKGLDIGLVAGRTVMTEAIPYCLMSGYEDYVAEKIIPETVIYDAEGTIESYSKYRHDEGKVKGEACRECARFDSCEGPWKEYPELFGWDEFVPIKKEACAPAKREPRKAAKNPRRKKVRDGAR